MTFDACIKVVLCLGPTWSLVMFCDFICLFQGPLEVTNVYHDFNMARA